LVIHPLHRILLFPNPITPIASSFLPTSSHEARTPRFTRTQKHKATPILKTTKEQTHQQQQNPNFLYKQKSILLSPENKHKQLQHQKPHGTNTRVVATTTGTTTIKPRQKSKPPLQTLMIQAAIHPPTKIKILKSNRRGKIKRKKRRLKKPKRKPKF
jgi:hypothetical protein